MKTQRMITAIFLASSLVCTGLVDVKSQTVVVEERSNIKPSVNNGSYRTAIGLRLGQTSGLTLKRYTGDRTAIEGIIGVWPNALSLTALFERYTYAGMEGLRWYYGAGGHVAFQTNTVKATYVTYDGRYYYYSYRAREDMGVGIDGLIGIEYKIPPIPFAISLDVKPFVEVSTSGYLYMFLDPGIGIKFTF